MTRSLLISTEAAALALRAADQNTGVPSPAEPVTYAGAALPAFWVSHTARAVTLASKFRSVPQLLGLSRRWLQWPSSQHTAASPLQAGGRRGQPALAHGSAGFWPARETPQPSLPVAENLRTALPLWKIVEAGQAGFPNLRTGVVQQFPLATQPMNQEDLSDAAVPRPPPV